MDSLSSLTMQNHLSPFDILTEDVLYAILTHLHPADLLRARQVCRRLQCATHQHHVWAQAYRKSDMVLPKLVLSSESSIGLEKTLLRALRLKQKWTGSPASLVSIRTFPVLLPVYIFAANVISGRYFMLADKAGLTWYDLDGSTWDMPILFYKCQHIVPSSWFLCHQVNAINEGTNSVWVAFVCGPAIIVLRVTFMDSKATIEFFAELPSDSVCALKISHDFLLPIKEFTTHALMDIFHIPSKRFFHFSPNSINVSPYPIFMHQIITSNFLIIMTSSDNETLFELFPLPQVSSPDMLTVSHSGIFKNAIFKCQPFSTETLPTFPDDRIFILALVYVRRDTIGWSCDIGFQIVTMVPNTDGSIKFSSNCHLIDASAGATCFASTAGRSSGLAVTHSSRGPTASAHYITIHPHAEATMTAKRLDLPEGIESRELLAFDGYRGRLCLISGWTRLDVIDYT